MATPSTVVREAGLHLSWAAARCLRGWVFLAPLPKAFKHSGREPRILEREADSKRKARPPGKRQSEEQGLARCPDMGTRPCEEIKQLCRKNRGGIDTKRLN
jgi:hypothetical protein